MDIKTLALILLVAHIISIFFIVFVIKRQRELSKLPIDPELLPFRQSLSHLAVAILIGSIIPIFIDVLTVFTYDSLTREDSPSLANIVYGVANAITLVISSYLIWTLYKQAAKTVLVVDKATEDALAKKNK